MRVSLVVALFALVAAGAPLAADDPAAARQRMVTEQIASRGVSDARVLAAMRKVPRHEFVPEAMRASAYDDTPLAIGYEQTISQPYIVATMTELAKLGPRSRAVPRMPCGDSVIGRYTYAMATATGVGPTRRRSTRSWSRPPRRECPPR